MEIPKPLKDNLERFIQSFNSNKYDRYEEMFRAEFKNKIKPFLGKEEFALYVLKELDMNIPLREKGLDIFKELFDSYTLQKIYSDIAKDFVKNGKFSKADINGYSARKQISELSHKKFNGARNTGERIDKYNDLLQKLSEHYKENNIHIEHYPTAKKKSRRNP